MKIPFVRYKTINKKDEGEKKILFMFHFITPITDIQLNDFKTYQ